MFGAAERVYLSASELIFMRSCDVIREQRYWKVRDCAANRRFTFCCHKKTAGWKSIKTEVKGSTILVLK